ncbi:transposase [Streptomyces sp. R1]|uniref:transposase n=1 Tax=Streptomyces sp. R1 TaxID=1509279 RepID=UPI0034D7793C
MGTQGRLHGSGAAVSEVTGPAHGDHCSGSALRRSADPEQMEAVFAELAADLAPVYRRRDLRANGVLYLRGLLMPGVSGNCWSIAEAVGLDRPYRLHHLLERARWEEDAARDVVRRVPGPAPRRRRRGPDLRRDGAGEEWGRRPRPWAGSIPARRAGSRT